jgi:hypothetical protein
MEARADLEAELAEAISNRTGAPNCARRPVEGREEPVSGCVDLVPTESTELIPNELMVLLQELSPRPVTELGRSRWCVDDVRERGDVLKRRSPDVRSG